MSTYENIKSAISLKIGSGERAASKRYFKKSGQWLLPSSSI